MTKRIVVLAMGLFLVPLATASLAQDLDVTVSPLNTPADLDLSGEIVYAVNFGDNGNPIFGDLVFSQDQDCPEVTVTKSAEGPTSQWQGVAPNTGYPNLNSLLHGVIWTYAEPSSITSISVDGLFVGMQYQLQLLFYTDGGRPMDIMVEDVTLLEGHDIYAAQGGVQGKGGSLLTYRFRAGDPTLNITLTAHGLASTISGFVLTELGGLVFADYGSGTTTELVSGKGTWQINWGQGPWTWSENEGNPLFGSNVSSVLALNTTAPAAVSADLVATLPIQGTLTLTARDPKNANVTIGTMTLSGTGVNIIDINASRVIVDEGSGIGMAPFHAPGPELAMTLDEATGVFAYIQPVGDWRLELAGLYAMPLAKEGALQSQILAALGGKVPLIGGLGTFALSGQYDPIASRMPQSFCEYGEAVTTSFGAAGGQWTQTWAGEPWPWRECPTAVNAKFLGQNVRGVLETTTSGVPSIDENMTLKSPFVGRITLTGYSNGRLTQVDGQILGDVAGTFVGDVNAAHATFDGNGNIVCAFGVAVHDAPDAMITVTEATGTYADIRQAGDWGWYVNGTMTIARVPDLSVQQNILASLQQPELLLGAHEEFVMTGWYYRQTPQSSSRDGLNRSR